MPWVGKSSTHPTRLSAKTNRRQAVMMQFQRKEFQVNRKLSQFIIGIISVFLLVGCNQTPDPKPPLTKPIQLDKAGQKVSIDFWANPRDSHEKNFLMVGLTVKKPNGDTFEDSGRWWELIEQQLTIKVSLTRIDGAEKPVSFRAYPSPELKKTLKLSHVQSGSIVYSDFFTYDGEFMLASVDREEAGLYRVEVEVVQDNPAFKDLNADLFVMYRLYGGK